MHGTAHLRHPLAIDAPAESPMRRCRFCGHPIQMYEHVGWVDVTATFRGGTYDMCEVEQWGSHEPQPPPSAGRVAGRTEQRNEPENALDGTDV
jgi:hypothetical protein